MLRYIFFRNVLKKCIFKKIHEVIKNLQGALRGIKGQISKIFEQVFSRSIEYVKTKEIGDLPQTHEKLRKKLKVDNIFWDTLHDGLCSGTRR